MSPPTPRADAALDNFQPDERERIRNGIVVAAGGLDPATWRYAMDAAAAVVDGLLRQAQHDGWRPECDWLLNARSALLAKLRHVPLVRLGRAAPVPDRRTTPEPAAADDDDDHSVQLPRFMGPTVDAELTCMLCCKPDCDAEFTWPTNLAGADRMLTAGLHKKCFESPPRQVGELDEIIEKCAEAADELSGSFHQDACAKAIRKLKGHLALAGAAAGSARARLADVLNVEIRHLRGHESLGPYHDCTDCGRAMVWQHGGDSPAWMCPNCVMRRLQANDVNALFPGLFAGRGGGHAKASAAPPIERPDMTCPACEGKGSVGDGTLHGMPTSIGTCARCGGTGRTAACQHCGRPAVILGSDDAPPPDDCYRYAKEQKNEAQWGCAHAELPGTPVLCDVCPKAALDGWVGTVASVDPCGCTVRVCADHGAATKPGERPAIDVLHAEKCPKRATLTARQRSERLADLPRFKDVPLGTKELLRNSVEAAIADAVAEADRAWKVRHSDSVTVVQKHFEERIAAQAEANRTSVKDVMGAVDRFARAVAAATTGQQWEPREAALAHVREMVTALAKRGEAPPTAGAAPASAVPAVTMEDVMRAVRTYANLRVHHGASQVEEAAAYDAAAALVSGLIRERDEARDRMPPSARTSAPAATTVGAIDTALVRTRDLLAANLPALPWRAKKGKPDQWGHAWFVAPAGIDDSGLVAYAVEGIWSDQGMTSRPVADLIAEAPGLLAALDRSVVALRRELANWATAAEDALSSSQGVSIDGHKMLRVLLDLSRGKPAPQPTAAAGEAKGTGAFEGCDPPPLGDKRGTRL